MVFYLAILVGVLAPLRLSVLEPNLYRVLIYQQERRIVLAVEREDSCLTVSLGSRSRSVTRYLSGCPRKKTLIHSNHLELGEGHDIISVPVEHPTSRRDYFGFFEPKSGAMILPIVPGKQDLRFRHYWLKLKPRFVFLLSFGKFKKDILSWTDGIGKRSQWFLPDLQLRDVPPWTAFHFRSEWPPLLDWKIPTSDLR